MAHVEIIYGIERHDHSRATGGNRTGSGCPHAKARLILRLPNSLEDLHDI